MGIGEGFRVLVRDWLEDTILKSVLFGMFTEGNTAPKSAQFKELKVVKKNAPSAAGGGKHIPTYTCFRYLVSLALIN